MVLGNYTNTLLISFPPLDILLGRVLLGRAARLGRHSEGRREEALDWDPHMQSLILIINYGCFCFFLPQPLTTQLLAVRGERGRERQREKEKRQFSSKRISYPNK